MKVHTANDWIGELDCGANFAYILPEENLFLPTQYKVLQDRESLVPCLKLLYNGKIGLFYRKDALKSVSSLLPSMNGDDFCSFTANLLRAVLQVKSVGFLPVENIDLSFDKIFVDKATGRVRLVYVPSGRKLLEDSYAFENELRAGLRKLISGVPTLSTPRTAALSVNLADSALRLEDVLKTLGTAVPEQKPKIQVLYLVPEKGDQTIRIAGDRFIIGRDSGSDYVFVNKYVGRTHCRVDYHDGQFYLTDLGSRNHTMLDGKKLEPNVEYPVRSGNTVHIATSPFRAEIKTEEGDHA